MPIFVYRNGQQEGPYEIADLREALNNGSLTENDLAWREGMADWTPLSNILVESAIGQNPALPPPAGSKTEPLSIWSLVLGVLSWACLSVIAGIPAIICGHLSLKKIDANPLLRGKGMAIAGLVLGYVSILLLFIILPALGLPALSGSLSRAKETASLNSARQLGLALQTAAIDAAIDEKKDEGWPADAGLKTAADVGQRLVAGNYLTKEDLEKIGLENFMIGNVAEKDPADTILVKSKTPTRGVSIVVLKNSEGFIVRDGKPAYGTDPPRDPPFLE